MPSRAISKTCEWCGEEWETRIQKSRTCSPTCRARLREQEHGPTNNSKPRVYPEEIVQRVRELYDSGLTVKEVQAEMGHGVKVQNVILRHNIKTRQAIKRDQRGEKNAMWKGDQAAYSALHRRVEAVRGKPRKCSACDTEDTKLRYEWANLTGAYEDINDFVRLCANCHQAIDNRMRVRVGGKLAGHVRMGGDANVR